MKKGYIYIGLTTFAFSTMEITSKIISNEINPFQLTFIRFFIGALLLLPFAIYDIKKKDISLNKNDLLFFAASGFLGILVSMSLFQLAVLYAKASTAAVIFSTNPVFTITLAYFILKEPLGKNTWISLSLSLIGIIFFLKPWAFNSDMKGVVLAILSAIVFSLYSVLGKLKIQKYGGIVLNCFTFFFGVLMLSFYMIYAHIPITKGITIHNIPYILYLGIFVTGLGYLFYFLAMKETSATTASTVFFIKPAIAPLLSLLILKEKISLFTFLGILSILIGAFIMFKDNTKKLN